jgi:hypothetical protein
VKHVICPHSLIDLLRKKGVNWKALQVSLVNDGPVTMQIDSPSLQGAAQSR